MPLIDILGRLFGGGKPIEDFFSAHAAAFKVHRIHALLAAEMLERTDLSPGFRAHLQAAVTAAKARHALYTTGLRTVINALRGAEIDCILLKGGALWRFYAHPWLRDQDDIDILIPDGRLTAAAGALNAAGLTMTRTERKSLHTGLAFAQSGMPDVELHTAITPAYKNRLDTRAFTARARPAEIAGVTVRILDDGDQLIHSIVHAANHHVIMRLQWLNDIRLMLAAGVDLSGPAAARGAAARSCYAVLHYTGLWLDYPAAHEAGRSVRTGRLFPALLNRLIPTGRLFDNPILTSKTRQKFYNIALVCNPLDIVRGVVEGMRG